MPGFSDTTGNAENIRSGNSNPNNDDILYKIYQAAQNISNRLDDIDYNLSGDPRRFSQGGARDSANDRTGPFKQRYNERQQGRNAWSGGRSKKPQSFTDGLEEALWEGLLGSDFKKNIGNVLNSFAKDLGVDIQDLQGEVGKRLGKIGMDAFKSTELGKKVIGKADELKSNLFKNLGQNFGNTATGQAARDAAKGAAKEATKNAAANTAKGVANEVGVEGLAGAGQAGMQMAELTSGMAAGGEAMAGLITTIGQAIPPLLAAIAVLFILDKALDKLAEAFEPAIEGTKQFVDTMKKSANRYDASRKQKLEGEIKRLHDDVEAMIKAPFDILQESAEKVEAAWDDTLRIINGTQGYTKADLQDLWSNYASRLRSEGLSGAIPATDINSGLVKVLESGLSGKVAEEFAYVATKLSAAVPTEDFFSYASDYASIAANQIRLGKSQSEAIAIANSELESFASNVLYASREIAGGFTTGLKDASSLFKSAVQIQQASKTGNVSTISGVLTSVAAITGAIAPDLSTAMTDAITKAAIGGNSSEIVALRSLAGINAGNTEFLRQLAEDPKSVFSTLFRNLANMQNMAPGANMEVAEGLSSVFGLSMDAFSRVDFNYLAQAISEMNINNASLDENLQHLASGETTTTAEEMRYKQINQYLIDEGLSYVLDNEVMRSVQEHMWQEQLAQEITEAEYAVNLQGSALTFLEGIRETMDKLINLLNPFSWVKKGAQLLGTAVEGKAQQADLRQIAELGKVGNGNLQALYQLTTRGVNLNLTDSYASMLGGFSLYETAKGARELYTALLPGSSVNNISTISKYQNSAYKALGEYIVGGLMSADFSSSESAYSWGTIGKSAYKSISTLGQSNISPISVTSGSSISQTSSDTTRQILQSKFDQLLAEDYVNKFVSEEDGYNKWVATAKNFGISDFKEAAEELGYTEEKLQSYFQAEQTAAYQKDQQQRLKDEEDFWKNTQDYQLIIKDNTITILSEIQTTNAHLLTIEGHWGDLLQKWSEYFVNHTVYNSRFNANDVTRINDLATQDSKEAVYKLADAIISGNKDLMDPNVQTNVLLSQILLVVQAIMQQNNTPGSLAIADTLQAMSTGLFNLNK